MWVCNFFRWMIIFVLLSQYECFIEWFWSSGENKEEIKKEGSEVGSLVEIPFELNVADEKFLAEAQNYGLQKSELDVCYHKVIMNAHSSCHDMNEEDIGKLSVHLLNCQSAVEGRPIFQCSSKMTLKQCTTNMDKITWNAYHIVSNRARAVCYAARQQQFNAKAEMTVNKLMSTTEGQLYAMKEIQVGQEKVGVLTEKTLETMTIGQQDLMVQQERLKISQHNIHNFVTGNLRELVREKALIAAGQKELADMTENIRKKLDEASDQLQKNEHDRLNNHQEILADLSTVQSKAQEVWQKIDNSTQRILQQHAQTAASYQQTLENLQRINDTVTHLMQLMEHMRKEVNLKLGWLGRLLDGTGDQLTFLNTCVLHAAYFFLAAIAATFIHAPYISRILLLLLVPLNALSEIQQRNYLNFYSISIIIAFSAIAQWSFSIIYQYNKKKDIYYLPGVKENHVEQLFERRNVEPQYDSHMDSSLEDLDYEENNSTASIDDSLSSVKLERTSQKDFLSNGYITPNTSLLKRVKRNLTADLDNISLVRSGSSRSSTPLRSSSRCSTPSRRTCAGRNRSGMACKNVCVVGKNFCYHHYKSQ